MVSISIETQGQKSESEGLRVGIYKYICAWDYSDGLSDIVWYIEQVIGTLKRKPSAQNPN